MRPDPYVGITGLQTVDDVMNFVRMADTPGLPDKIMLGFTCSNKRLADPDSSGKTSPSLNSVIQMLPKLVKYKCYLPMMHYYTSDLSKLAEEIKFLFSHLYTQGLCRAVQLNAEWPDIMALREIKDALPELQIVLQLPKQALTAYDGIIVEKASHYNSHIDYLLIDPSGGTGDDVDIERGARLINVLSRAMPNVTLGIAGGFSADNVGVRVASLNRMTTAPYCIDAQGKLRTYVTPKVSQLDIAKCMMYLANANHANSLERVYTEIRTRIERLTGNVVLPDTRVRGIV